MDEFVSKYLKSLITGSKARVETQLSCVDCLLCFVCLLVKTFGITLAIQFHQEKNKYSKAETLNFYQ